MAIATTPAKAIYLANRHPRFNRHEFAERWRHHGRSNGSGDLRIGEIAGLRYCLTESPAGVLPGASDEYDGVALLSLRGLASAATVGTMLRDNEVAYADELRTFERPVHECSLLTASELIVPGAETGVVVFAFVRRRSDVRPLDFVQALNAAAAAAAPGLAVHGLRRWVGNLLVAPARRGFAYDAVHELWFDSLEAVAAARDALDAWFAHTATHDDRATSVVLVTSVIERVGRDRP